MNNKKKNLWQAVKFTLFSASAGIIQIASFAIIEIFIQTYWIPYLTSLVLSILWNFTLNRKYTFQSAANVPIAMLKVAAFYLVFTPVSAWLGQLLVDMGCPSPHWSLPFCVSCFAKGCYPVVSTPS